MDDEDVKDAEEARLLHTASSYAGVGDADPNSSSLATTQHARLIDLFTPSGETVGVKLLKRMGWRPGQGIGPMVRRKARLGPETTNAEDDEPTHLFAPENTPVIHFAKKTDCKGLGFVGEQKLGGPERGRLIGNGNDDNNDYDPFSRLSSKPAPASKIGVKPRVPLRRGGIGTGVLNSDDEDEDPYEIAPRLSYNRVIDADKQAKKKKNNNKKLLNASDSISTHTSNSNPLLSTKPVFIKRKPGLNAGQTTSSTSSPLTTSSLSGFRKCRDGRLPLEGFILSLELSNLSLGENYPPPRVPEGWEPKKLRLSASQPTDSTSTPSQYRTNAEIARDSKLDPTSRAALLGEKQLPGMSVYDFMTPEARERIAKATGRTDLPPARGQKGPMEQGKKSEPRSESEKEREAWGFVPHLDRWIAKQVLERGTSGSFMPYAEDEAKRDRYRAFLKLKAGVLRPEEEKLPERPPGMGLQEWIAEMNEFARCAMVFRPASGAMASRFTSASSSATVMTPSAENLLRRPKEKQLTPAEEAAKMGMYGHLTREVTPFHPSRLLCKRFGVMMPTPTDAAEETANEPRTTGGASELLSTGTMERIIAEAQKATSSSSTTEPGDRSSNPAREAAYGLRQPVVVDPGRNEALEAERPGDDVFKAVFGDENDEMEGDVGGLDD